MSNECMKRNDEKNSCSRFILKNCNKIRSEWITFLFLIEKRLDKYVVIVRIHCIISNYSFLRRINIFFLSLFCAHSFSLILMIDKSRRYPINVLIRSFFFLSCFQAIFNSNPWLTLCFSACRKTTSTFDDEICI